VKLEHPPMEIKNSRTFNFTSIQVHEHLGVLIGVKNSECVRPGLSFYAEQSEPVFAPAGSLGQLQGLVDSQGRREVR